MKSAYNKKATSILQWVANLALLATASFAVVIFVSFVFTLSGEGELISSYNVRITEQVSDLQLMSENSPIDNPKSLINKGVITFSSRNVGYYLLKLLDVIIVILPAIYIIVLLKKTLHSLQMGHPFTNKNALRLKHIAVILILTSPYNLIKSLVYRSYIINNIKVEKKTYADVLDTIYLYFSPPANKVWLDLDINFQALITGVILLVIAEVFRVGILIKEDNESIV